MRVWFLRVAPNTGRNWGKCEETVMTLTGNQFIEAGEPLGGPLFVEVYAHALADERGGHVADRAMLAIRDVLGEAGSIKTVLQQSLADQGLVHAKVWLTDRGRLSPSFYEAVSEAVRLATGLRFRYGRNKGVPTRLGVGTRFYDAGSTASFLLVEYAPTT